MHQVSIARHYGSLRKFTALGDDRAAIRTACLQDFALPADSPENRSQIAATVSAWETSKEYLAKEVELKAEAKVLGQPRILPIWTPPYLYMQRCATSSFRSCCQRDLPINT